MVYVIDRILNKTCHVPSAAFPSFDPPVGRSCHMLLLFELNPGHMPPNELYKSNNARCLSYCKMQVKSGKLQPMQMFLFS